MTKTQTTSYLVIPLFLIVSVHFGRRFNHIGRGGKNRSAHMEVRQRHQVRQDLYAASIHNLAHIFLLQNQLQKTTSAL